MRDARTVAATVLLAVGLFLVIALERGAGRRTFLSAALCVALAAAYAGALLTPWTRDFFALGTLGPAAALIAAGAAALGIAVAWCGLRRLGA